MLEVVWTKEALLIFGNSTMSAAAVIAAYMTGLALGSFLFGRVADDKPALALFLYGLLEGGVGFFALFFPFLTRSLNPVYERIYVWFGGHFIFISFLRFLLSFLLLMIPTTLMGGTLPLLSKFLSRRPKALTANIGALYAMNLFGAMTGAFASGFVLISRYGLRMTSVLAASLNLCIFLYLAISLRKRLTLKAVEGIAETEGEGAPESLSGPAPDRRTFGLILGLLVVHGFGAFVAQICWTRTLALILGSSTYSFSAMLTTFLAGLGLGAWVISLIIRWTRGISLAAIGLIEMAMGASIILFIPVFEWLIYYFVTISPSSTTSLSLIFMTQFVFCAAAMIVPTTVMGLVFPAVIAYLGKPKDIGRIVGLTYAADTLGGVAGAVMAAFIFISHIGLNGSLRFVGLLCLGAGFVVVLMSRRPKEMPYLRRAGAITVLSALFLFHPWDKAMFSSGVFIYAHHLTGLADAGKKAMQSAIRKGTHILFYKDGLSATVTVFQMGKDKSLRVNGKVEASTTGDMETQLLVSYVPLFAHPDPKDVLVIGLGSGITLSAAAEFASVERIDCVEIEPAVVEASRFFSVENRDVLKDPRVKMIIGDGRNHLEFSPKRYDVIISEPSNPWISGVSNLFSIENYRAALSKLKTGGVYGQWLHAYQMAPDDFLMIMHTFTAVFPHANLFKISRGDYLLVGSAEPVVFDYRGMMKAIGENESIRERARTFFRCREDFLLGSFFFSDRDLREALASAEKRINTDDHLILEYSAPKNLYRRESDHILYWLYWNVRRDRAPAFRDPDPEGAMDPRRLAAVFWWNGRDAMFARSHAAALSYLKEALRLNPDDHTLIYETAMAYELTEQYAEARQLFSSLTDVPAWRARGQESVERVDIREKMKNDPSLALQADLHNRLGYLEFIAGDMPAAERSMMTAIRLDPTYGRNYSDLSYYYFRYGQENKGRDMLLKAEKYNERGDSASLSRAEGMYEQARLRRAKHLKSLKERG